MAAGSGKKRGTGGLVGNYYVRPTTDTPPGSDSNNGPSRTPASATLQKASTVATAGQTVGFLAGNYPGRGDVVSSSGTAGNPITYISEVQWGARLIGIAGQTCNNGYFGRLVNHGSWNIFDGFEIDMTLCNAGGTDTSWQFGLYTNAQNVTVKRCWLHHLCTNLTQYNLLENAAIGGGLLNHDWWNDGSPNNTLFDRCLVHDAGPISQSSTHLHTVSLTGAGGTITNCIIYNSVGEGIAMWHGATTEHIVNNVLYNIKGNGITAGAGDSGLVAGGNANTRVNNNIIHTAAGHGLKEEGTVGSGGNANSFINNICFNCAQGASLFINATSSGTTTGDPLFVSTSTPDFHLQAGSPGINTGTATLAPSTDFSGATRPQGATYDRGAYEQ